MPNRYLLARRALRQFTARSLGVVSGLLLGVLALGQASWAQPTTETLSIRFFQVTAEVVRTPEQRARGLMGRPSLPPNHGMLFVFEEPSRQCFWMRNTPLPLTIAFIDDQGTIVNVADMEPFSEAPHCSQKPVRFALEMEQGWFRKRGVLVGDAVSGPSIAGR